MRPQLRHLSKLERGGFRFLLGVAVALKSNQETCDDRWKIGKNCTRKEIVTYVCGPLEAKGDAFEEKMQE